MHSWGFFFFLAVYHSVYELCGRLCISSSLDVSSTLVSTDFLGMILSGMVRTVDGAAGSPCFGIQGIHSLDWF